MTATALAPTTSAPSPTTRASYRRWRSLAGRPEWIVFAVALAARLTVVFRSGGVNGLYGYDSGVYFAGADSLIHGRMPYADYVQLHPPGITVALTPFALLTHVLSDSSAFTVAILAFSVLGAVNAVLVTRVCRGLGLGRAGAVAGGLCYALWMNAVGAEYLIKLEPLGNVLVLGGLLLTLRAQRRDARWPSVLAGAPLGLAVSVKVWWIVPVIAIACWHGRRLHSRRRGTELALGAAAAAVLFNLPFFIAAPRQMWSMVVVDQLTRTRPASTSLATRSHDLTGVGYFRGAAGEYVFLALVAVLVLLAAAGAWRVRAARPAVVLLAVQLAVVLAAPSWFAYYADYLTVSLSITVAGAACGGVGRLATPARCVAAALVVTMGAMTGVILAGGRAHAVPFRGASALARAVAPFRCVMTDSPAAQLRLNALSRGLAAGCPNLVDVGGPTYGPYRSTMSRAHNPRWQRAFLAYLRQGRAVILVRGATSGATPAFQAAIDGAPIATAGGHTVYRVRS